MNIATFNEFAGGVPLPYFDNHSILLSGYGSSGSILRNYGNKLLVDTYFYEAITTRLYNSLGTSTTIYDYSVISSPMSISAGSTSSSTSTSFILGTFAPIVFTTNAEITYNGYLGATTNITTFSGKDASYSSSHSIYSATTISTAEIYASPESFVVLSPQPNWVSNSNSFPIYF
jgi:hypothetical protein